MILSSLAGGPVDAGYISSKKEDTHILIYSDDDETSPATPLITKMRLTLASSGISNCHCAKSQKSNMLVFHKHRRYHQVIGKSKKHLFFSVTHCKKVCNHYLQLKRNK